MKKPLPGIVLVVLGILLFFAGGGMYTDTGIIGIILFIVGILTLLFPKHLEKFNTIKSKQNVVALIILGVIFIISLIYIWWKRISIN